MHDTLIIGVVLYSDIAVLQERMHTTIVRVWGLVFPGSSYLLSGKSNLLEASQLKIQVSIIIHCRKRIVRQRA